MPLLTKTELIRQFKQSLVDKIQYESTHPLPIRDTSKHQIYSVEQLSALQASLQNSGVDDGRLAKYVISHKKKMLLARAGERSASIPGHVDMSSGPMLAAGYIFFNDSGDVTGLSSEVTELILEPNNPTVFNELNMHSMLWPVLILSLAKIPMAESFSLISSHGELALTSAERSALISTIPLTLGRALVKANQEAIPKRTPISTNRAILFPMPSAFNKNSQHQRYDETHLTTLECGNS